MAFKSQSVPTYTKWPRQYAAEIAELPTKEQRAAALAKVPKELRPIAKKHIEIIFMRRR